MTQKDKRSEKPRSKQNDKAVKRTSIGGQAVLEGVMMKGTRSIATAVRAQSGEITVESKYVKSAKERNAFLRLPFVRGVVNLVSQLFQGTGILMRSAEVYGDFAEPGRFEKWMADKLKINPMNVLMAFSVILGIALAVGLFVFLPNFLTGLLFEIPALSNTHPALQSLSEGAMMLVIFILYILAVSLMKDIRRVFMYHGAEHKVISCYEHGLELSVENAKKMSRAHSRCGTTFMFFVIAVSILVFALVNWLLGLLGWLTDNNAVNAFIKLGVKILFLPVIAGFSYELLKLLAKSDCLLARILRAPGMLLQKLTTKEPTDDMLEVSITAFKTVMEMDEDNGIPERTFDIRVPYAIARKRIGEIAESADESDLDWIMTEVAGVKRSELAGLATLTKQQYDNAQSIAGRMTKGEPLQYALGNTEFYGIKLAVNPNVLIPRPETEELAEKTINEIKSRNANSVRCLDLCTGSGAVAIAVKKHCECVMCASDISEAALTIAKANALSNGADIEFCLGNLFEAAGGRTFDVISANPPYIPSADIASLDAKVRNFEPSIALNGGEDGLDFYRAIEKDLSARLNEGGIMLCEFGINQASDIKKIFEKFNVEIIKDMSGLERIARISVK